MTDNPENGNGNGKEDDFDSGFGDSFDNSFGGSEGLAPPRTLGDIWRESMPFKIGVIIAGIAVIILGILLFSGGKKDINGSQAPRSSSVSSTPGTEAVSQEYTNRLEDKDRQNLDAAIRTGGSAIPTVIDPPQVRAPLPEDTGMKDDPLQRWRDLQAQSKKQEEVEKPAEIVRTGPTIQEQNQAVGELAGIMSEQMASILDKRSAAAPTSQGTINSKKWLEAKIKAKEEKEAEAKKQEVKEKEEEKQKKIIIPTGEIEYAQLLIEANSDVPGPVMAQLASGPLKGSRILGKFEVQNEYLTLTFDTIVIDGVAGSVDAIALDPGTTLPGMATEVKQRYFKRIVLPAAAAFVEGMSTSLADTVTSIAVTGDTVVQENQNASTEDAIAAGVAELGSSLREELDDIADKTEILVKIHAGTPMGILFLSPVLEGGNSDPTYSKRNDDSVSDLRNDVDARFEEAGKKINDRFDESDRQRKNDRYDRYDRYDRRLNRRLNNSGIYRIR